MRCLCYVRKVICVLIALHSFFLNLESSDFSFGITNSSAVDESQNPTFSFGKKSITPSQEVSQGSSAVFNFGTSSLKSSLSQASQESIFTFGNSTNASSGQSSNESQSLDFSFGNVSTVHSSMQPVSVLPDFNFGTTHPAVGPALLQEPAFSFGQKKIDTVGDTTFIAQLLEIRAEAFTLFEKIEKIIKNYSSPVSVSTVNFSFGTSSGAKEALSPTNNSLVAKYEPLDTEAFAAFKNCFLGTDSSYFSILMKMWGLYAQEIKLLQQLGATDKAQACAQEPFKNKSYFLMTYIQAVGQIVSFLKMRVASFSVDNYWEPRADYFLTTEISALDGIIAQMEQLFETHFLGTSSDGYLNVSSLAGQQSAVYKSNYQAVQIAYKKQKAQILTHFIFTLFQSLSNRYSPVSVQNQAMVRLMNNDFSSSIGLKKMSILDQYYALAVKQLTENQTLSVGIYSNSQIALQALQGFAGSLYVYAALVGQNNITALCKTTDAYTYQNQIDGIEKNSLFVQKLQGVLTQVDSYYQKAGQIYNQQANLSQATLYAQISACIETGIGCWKKGDAFVQNKDFASAINAYQSAAQLFQKMGNAALSFLLLHKVNSITLLYYQQLFDSYLTYYQQILPTFISKMSTPPEGIVEKKDAMDWHTGYPQGLVQLFYYDAGATPIANKPLFQGMAWLAEQAIPGFSSMLTMHYTDVKVGSLPLSTYLSKALTLLENISQAARGMFYNDPLLATNLTTSTSSALEEMAAHANIGSGSVKGVTEAYLQYIKIYELFKKVDMATITNKERGTIQSGILDLPYQGLFKQESVTGFSDFSLLIQLYWSLMNVDSTVALATSYPDYTQEVISAALILLMHAQALSLEPSLQGVLSNGYRAWIENKLQGIAKKQYGVEQKTGIQLLVLQGMRCADQANSALDYEAALFCFVTAGLLGDTTAQQNYFSVLKSYAQWYTTASGVDFADFYEATVYYRGYLAQQKGWVAVDDFSTLLKTSMQQFVQDLNSVLQKQGALSSAQNYTEALEQIKKLVNLSDQMNFMIVRQKREQEIFGLTGKDLLIFQVSVLPQGQSMMNISYPFSSEIAPVIFVDPRYSLAKCYYDSAKTILANLQIAGFKNNNSFQDSYNLMSTQLLNALDSCNKGGYQEQALQVQNTMTQAAAFMYLSSVIPSQTTAALCTRYFSGVSSNTKSAGTSGVKTSSPVSYVPEEPAYLLRYGEQDLTLLAAQEKTDTQTGSIQKSSSVNVFSYTDVLQKASALLGSLTTVTTTLTDTNLITDVVVPLYRTFLVTNAYTNPCATLDQEVERYTKQVENGVTKGTEIVGKIRLFTTYSLEKRIVAGTEHIFLISHYSPLEAIPRMQNEFQTALTYYMRYAQFFAVNPQVVQIDGQFFYQITDADGSKKNDAWKNILGTYLAKAFEYKTAANAFMTMAPPLGTLETIKAYTFSNYEKAYGLVSNAYSLSLSYVAALFQAQQDAGVMIVSSKTSNEIQYNLYKRYMKDSALFLVGDPLSSSYKNVMGIIAGLSTACLQYTDDISDKQEILQTMGEYYEVAGDTTQLYDEQMPSVAGYPDPSPTKIPQKLSDGQSLSSSNQCLSLQSLGLQQPVSYTLVWKKYFNASSYYQQAYTYYQQAAALKAPAGSAALIDKDSRRGWGKFIQAVMSGIGQRFALFGRNAFTATQENQSDGSSVVVMSVNPYFVSLMNTDQSALQGFDALSGGGQNIVSPITMQGQYGIMKNIVLDALIYCTSVQELLNQLCKLGNTSAQKGTDDSKCGRAIQCGLAYFVPGIQMVVGQKISGAQNNLQTQVPVQLVPAAQVTLNVLGNATLRQIIYANTFPLFLDYCIGSLMGICNGRSDSNPYSGIVDAASLNALNDFVSQVYGALQEMYAVSFLPPAAANDPQEMTTDVIAAMKAEEQNMIINPEDYIG